MSFKVTPSDQVVINIDEVGDDDLLKVELENRTVLYIERHKIRMQYVQLRFVPNLLPEYLTGVIDDQTRRVISEAMRYSNDRAALKEWFEKLYEPDVRTAVWNAIYENGVSVAQEVINIGKEVSGTLQFNFQFLSGPVQRTKWAFDTPIVHITPIDRWSAELEVAAR